MIIFIFGKWECEWCFFDAQPKSKNTCARSDIDRSIEFSKFWSQVRKFTLHAVWFACAWGCAHFPCSMRLHTQIKRKLNQTKRSFIHVWCCCNPSWSFFLIFLVYFMWLFERCFCLSLFTIACYKFVDLSFPSMLYIWPLTLWLLSSLFRGLRPIYRWIVKVV